MRVVRLTAVALALGLAGGGTLLGAPAASAAGTGFVPIHQLPYRVDALTSPDDQTIVAVSGSAGWVDGRLNGQWVHQSLGNSFEWAGAASDGGVVWVGTRQNSSYYSTLWRSNNGKMEWVDLPPIQTPEKRFIITSVAAEGATGVVGGMLVERGTDAYGHEIVLSRQAVIARLTGSTWNITYPQVDTTSVDIVGAASGRTIGRTTPVGSEGSYLYDLTTAQPGWYGTAGGKTFTGAQTYTASTLVNGYDITLWGGSTTRDTAGAVTEQGLCKHFANGTAVSCPAPAWPVSDAERLADGRVVLAGGTDSAAGTQSSGFAVAAPDGTLTPVDGAAGARTQVAASAFGTHAWAAVPSADGTSTTILEADLAR